MSHPSMSRRFFVCMGKVDDTQIDGSASNGGPLADTGRSRDFERGESVEWLESPALPVSSRILVIRATGESVMAYGREYTVF